MANAKIGAMHVSLSAETSRFEAGMKRSQRTAQNTANSIVGSFKQAGGAMNILRAGVTGFIASLSVGTIIAAGKAALDYAGSLGETSQQLGVTTRDLQVFRYAAGQLGVSQEEVDKGLGKLTITLGQVAAGAAAPTKALAAIGVTLEDLKGKDTGEAFRIIADGLQKVEDRSQRAAVEVALFGRTGAKLDNLLAGGSSQINELADAAERLGIVLSDEQIQKADDTADKLEALATVLKAKIAGEVADNSNAILELADSLLRVASAADRALERYNNFINNFSLPALFAKARGAFEATQFGVAGNSVRVKLPPATRLKQGPTTSISPFLASGGGGSRRRSGGGRDDSERKRQQALRDANQFDQEIRRAQIDVLGALRDLSADYVERTTISVQMLDAERAAYEAQLKYEVAAGERTKVQADQLQLEYDRKDQLERDKLKAEEAAQAREDSNRLDQLQYELERDRLESEGQLAETASEARDVQLRLLDLMYRQERARLEAVLADEQSSEAAKEEARRRLANLNRTFGNDRQGVINGTRGPLESYINSLPLTAEKMNEALQSVAVNGLQSLEDGLMSIIDGTESVGEAFRKMAMSIIADLIRISLQKMLIGPLASLSGSLLGGASGSLPGFAGGGLAFAGAGFASGGFVSGPGTPRSDSIPAMLSNGEFVVNAMAARRFLPLLRLMNAGRIGRFAEGGLVGVGAGGPVSATSASASDTAMSEFTAALKAAAPVIEKFTEALKDSMPQKKGPLGMLFGLASGGLFGLAGGGMGGGAGGLGSILGSLPGFASGGRFEIGGRPGIDRNVMSINGLPIAKVSYGERVNISNENQPMRGGMTVYAPVTVQGNASRETALQIEGGIRRAVGRATRHYG